MATEESTKMLCGYNIMRVLGQGSFGTVKLGVHPVTGEKVAIKTLNYKALSSGKEYEMIQREKEILMKLNHPHIIHMKEIVEDTEKDKCHMVFEYAAGGELFAYIVAHGKLKENDARRFIRQIVSGLEYCHSHLIIHRDLKPENLLLDAEMNIKISDFGLANRIKPGTRFQTFCGSLLYAAPEILEGYAYTGPGVDIWALGIILFCLVAGRQPFEGDAPVKLLKSFKHSIPFPDHVSSECRDLIKKMLTISEKERITIAEIKKHPWVNIGYTAPINSLLPAVSYVKTIEPEILSQLALLGFKNTPELRRKIIQSDLTHPAVTMYHTIKKNLIQSGQLSQTSSASNFSDGYSTSRNSGTESGVDSLESSEASGIKKNKKKRSKSVSKRRSTEVDAPPVEIDSANTSPCGSPASSSPLRRRKNSRETGERDLRSSAYARIGDKSTETSSSEPQSHDDGVVQTRKRRNSLVVSSNNEDFVTRRSTSPMESPADKTSNRRSEPRDRKEEGDKEKAESKSLKKKGFRKSRNEEKDKDMFDVIEGVVMDMLNAPKKEKGEKTKSDKDKSEKKKDRRKSVGHSKKEKAAPAQAQSKIFAENPLYEHTGLFGAQTTSTKSPQEISQQIEKVLERMAIRHLVMPNSVMYSCVLKNIAFEVELVEISKFENMRGLKFTRRSGDMWEYKQLIETLTAMLKL